MEVLVGPTYDMEVSASSSSSSLSTPSCVRDRTTGVPSAPTPTPAPIPAQVQDKILSSSCLFLNDDDDEEEEEEGGDREIGDKLVYIHGSDDSPESSSSIGVPSDSEDENDEISSNEGEELHRTKFSMDLFGDNLPIKRGLSSHYSGKSKSFGNLSEVTTMKNLEKEENPFNKRRRVLIASKLWSRNSFYSRSNPKSMPLLPILPDEDDDEKEDEVLDEDGDEDQHQAEH